MKVIHVDNTPTKKECKNCEWCDIYNNLCMRDNTPAYNKGKCLHEGCKRYEQAKGYVPDWYEFIEDDDELDLAQQSVRGR